MFNLKQFVSIVFDPFPAVSKYFKKEMYSRMKKGKWTSAKVDGKSEPKFQEQFYFFSFRRSAVFRRSMCMAQPKSLSQSLCFPLGNRFPLISSTLKPTTIAINMLRFLKLANKVFHYSSRVFFYEIYTSQFVETNFHFNICCWQMD